MADISKEDLRKEIAAILQDADLNSMSTKRVRTLLEEQLEIDLTERKKEVDALVMKCLKEIQSPKSGNGVNKDDDDDEEEDEDEDEEEEEEKKPKAKKLPTTPAKKPAAKRPKKAASDSDEASADEDAASDDDYSPAKKAKATPKKKAGKKKGKDDSDDEGDDEEWSKASRKKGAKGGKGGKKKGGTNTGYTKAYTLTPELAAVVGQDAMARHEVVKKVWAIIKERNLYDPKNKQFAICDDELLKVFGVKRFRTFGMMKYLKTHFITE